MSPRILSNIRNYRLDLLDSALQVAHCLVLLACLLNRLHYARSGFADCIQGFLLLGKDLGRFHVQVYHLHRLLHFLVLP